MKTPLTIISGYAQMILDDGYKDEKILNKGATKIKIESNRMYKMVLDLLTMSKLESYADINREEKINIEEIINTTCEDMTIRANKYNIKIKKCLQKNLFICGNKEEIRRMIINIIDNSIKYGNVKSTIIISLYSEDNFCVLTVQDEGEGIPENKIHKIYDSFYRVDKKGEREKGSNGLGLTIVKSIVEAHKGKIKIESTEGVGTKIYINLPCLQIDNNCL